MLLTEEEVDRAVAIIGEALSGGATTGARAGAEA
jgi:hypothetical protein